MHDVKDPGNAHAVSDEESGGSSMLIANIALDGHPVKAGVRSKRCANTLPASVRRNNWQRVKGQEVVYRLRTKSVDQRSNALSRDKPTKASTWGLQDGDEAS